MIDFVFYLTAEPGAEQLSTLLVAIKMRNQIDNDLQDELFGRMEDNGTRSTYQYHC